MIGFDLGFEIFGNTLNDYMISLVIFLLTFLAMTISNRFLKKYLLNWARKTETKWDELLVARIFVPVTYFGLIIGAVMVKRNLNLSEKISFWTDKTLLILGLITFFYILIRFVQGFIEAVTDEYIKKIEKQIREIVSMVLAIYSRFDYSLQCRGEFQGYMGVLWDRWNCSGSCC